MLDVGVSAYNALAYVSGYVMGKDGRVRKQHLTDRISRKNIQTNQTKNDVFNVFAPGRLSGGTDD